MKKEAEQDLEQRIVEMSRESKETRVQMRINLDGQGNYEFDTPIPFFEHMLSHICKQAMIDMQLQLQGDIGIDCHHSVEDTAIVLGTLLSRALKDKAGIFRYGHFTLPMDEVLATVAIDLSGRFAFIYHGPKEIKSGKFGIYDAELSLEFLQKFAMFAGMNLHVQLHYGDNRHHMHEAIFKGLGHALRRAVCRDPRRGTDLASTKGLLD